MLTGILLSLFTSLCWAVANVFIQKGARAVGTVRALFWSVTVGALLACPLGMLVDGPLHIPNPRTLGFLAVTVVSGLAAYLGMFYAFEKALLSVAVPMVSAWALIAAVVSLTLLGETASLSHVVGGAIVLTGVMAVGWGSSRSAGKDHRRASGLPLISALVGAVGFGIMVPSLGQVAPHLGAVTTAGLTYLLFLVVGIPIALGFRVPLAPPPPGARYFMLAAGAAETAGFVAVALAPRYAPMTVVAPLSSLAATLTVTYAWLFMRERQNKAVLAGAVVVCAGVVILSL